MAGYLYWVVKHEDKPITRDELAKDFDFPMPEGAQVPGRRFVGGGPSGTPGFLFRMQNGAIQEAVSPQLTYDKNSQTWVNVGKYWIGWLKDTPPVPYDLLRTREDVGHIVKMRDGNNWKIPAVRQITGECGLPHVFGFDDKGQPSEVLAPEHQEVWDKACKIFESLTEVGAASTPFSEAMRICGLAMKMNYWITDNELRARRMCSNEELILMSQAVVDWPTFLRLQEFESERKKKEVSTSSV